MARSPIKSLDRLDRVKGLPRPVESAHGATIVEATLAALALPAPQLPTVREYEPTPAEKFRSDALWSAAQAICAGQGLDPALVASRQDLTDFWVGLRDGTPPADHRIMKGWRREALGQPLSELVNGARGSRSDGPTACCGCSRPYPPPGRTRAARSSRYRNCDPFNGTTRPPGRSGPRNA